MIDGPALSLVITAANAKVIAAHALLQTTNQVNMLGSAGPLVALANGGVVNANSLKTAQPCSAGGYVLVTGAIAGTAGLNTGDTVQSSYQNCRILANGRSAVYLDGSATQAVTSGSASAIPFQITLTGGLNNVRIGTLQSDGALARTHTLTGNEQLEWTAASAASQTWSISGTTLTNKSTAGTIVRMDNWGAYRQTVVIAAGDISYSLHALVNSDNTQLGANGSIYMLRTVTPLVTNATTGLLSAGAVEVDGNSNAKLYVTIGASGVVSLFVDANGDGRYETIVSTTTSELSTLP